MRFQSTLPVRGATSPDLSTSLISACFNPRSPCGERLAGFIGFNFVVGFNPRSPCGERPGSCRGTWRSHEFQSTLPVRGATLPPPLAEWPFMFQSTLPVRGATERKIFLQELRRFQSTLPVRGATEEMAIEQRAATVSIHAPRAGSDEAIPGAAVSESACFNPRSPCGERPGGNRGDLPQAAFQSTLPVRGATVRVHIRILPKKFQSTLPVRGATKDGEAYYDIYTFPRF